MSNIKLYTLAPGHAVKIPSAQMQLEKDLQRVCEANLETLFDARLVQSEFQLGRSRIDTVALGDGNCPVILEYKRRADETVTTQSLSYMTELHDRPDSLWKAVSKKFDQQTAEGLDWSAPRIICIAAEFSDRVKNSLGGVKWDVELIQYRVFGKDTLLLEHLNAHSSNVPRPRPTPKPSIVIEQRVIRPKIKNSDRLFSATLSRSSAEIQSLVEQLRQFIKGLGTDVKELQHARILVYRRQASKMAAIHIRPRLGTAFVYLNLQPDDVRPEEGFARDMRRTSHQANGYGDLRLAVRSKADLERAKLLLRKAYAVA